MLGLKKTPGNQYNLFKKMLSYIYIYISSFPLLSQIMSAMVRVPTPPKQPRSILKTSACKPSSAPPLRTFNEPEEVINANVTEPLQIIRIICENKNLGFLYMTPAVPKSSIEYDTYNLK